MRFLKFGLSFALPGLRLWPRQRPAGQAGPRNLALTLSQAAKGGSDPTILLGRQAVQARQVSMVMVRRCFPLLHFTDTLRTEAGRAEQNTPFGIHPSDGLAMEQSRWLGVHRRPPPPHALLCAGVVLWL